MKRLELKIMMEGLVSTAIEKICVLGFEDSKEDVEKIIDMIEDLECFWNSSGKLSSTNWMEEINSTVEALRTRIE